MADDKGAKAEAHELSEQARYLKERVDELMAEAHRLTVVMNLMARGYNPAEFDWRVTTWEALNLTSCEDELLLSSRDEVVDTKAITKQLRKALEDWIMQRLSKSHEELDAILARIRVKKRVEPKDMAKLEAETRPAEPAELA